MASRKPPARQARRQRARVHGRLVRDLERLAALAPGGSAARPIALASPAQVEVRARATPCPLCQGTLVLDEHAAVTIANVALRVARLTCTMCGTRRELFFRLAAPPH